MVTAKVICLAKTPTAKGSDSPVDVRFMADIDHDDNAAWSADTPGLSFSAVFTRATSELFESGHRYTLTLTED
ncbi:hypothetical protein [Krasilnikovia sp. MM14-A1259]|uniref:hypothetical protein n=1 Tax=Krasilnikovia sp. MM14-A1259 TaxID=3373539 RepID=UPI003802CB41